MPTLVRPPLYQRIERRSQQIAYESQQPLNLLGTTLVTVVVNPFFLLDWPTPQKRHTLADDWQNNLLETTLAYPFFNYDWTNPETRRRESLWDWQNNLLGTTLVSVEANPFFQSEWHNPSKHISNEYLEMQQLDRAILAPSALRPMRTKHWHRNR